jgi:hypothetical protein
MSFQAPITISEALSSIRERRLLLPAIQREFVWEAWQVEWLFDSLLQGYPIGSFLFWEVRDNQSKNDFQYYEFLRTYRERFLIHNEPFATAGHYDFDAVLDGQQRLTALYIGLLGTYAYRMPRTRWENNEHALPTRRRCARHAGARWPHIIRQASQRCSRRYPCREIRPTFTFRGLTP